jgi:hypothetical protein
MNDQNGFEHSLSKESQKSREIFGLALVSRILSVRYQKGFDPGGQVWPCALPGGGFHFDRWLDFRAAGKIRHGKPERGLSAS